jgi:hypothetical protein
MDKTSNQTKRSFLVNIALIITEELVGKGFLPAVQLCLQVPNHRKLVGIIGEPRRKDRVSNRCDLGGHLLTWTLVAYHDHLHGCDQLFDHVKLKQNGLHTVLKRFD